MTRFTSFAAYSALAFVLALGLTMLTELLKLDPSPEEPWDPPVVSLPGWVIESRNRDAGPREGLPGSEKVGVYVTCIPAENYRPEDDPVPEVHTREITVTRAEYVAAHRGKPCPDGSIHE
ncbi:hypothetical protein [Nonomuraea sp. NPDC059022]|uniref:hypothetical protein n=1 Tax=Nonomuraea sp. NPDC059022 TaxID=3346705 RepID=UPI0036CCADED